MRVGLLIYGELGTQSGGYLYDRRLVDYLRRQGDTVEVLSLPPRGCARGIADNFRAGGLLEAGLDVLVQDELVHPSVFLLNRRLRARHAYPIVGLVHLFAAFARQGAWQAWLRRRLETRYLQSLDGVILNSRNTLQQARELSVGAPLPHVVAVPAGDHLHDNDTTSVTLETRLGKPGPLKVLYVGSLTRQKGLDVLLRALHALPAGEFSLTVTGRLDMEPGYARDMRRLVKRLGLEDRVKLTGPMEMTALPAVYRTHHVLAMPSVNEAYGIVYLEAQRFGLPAIGTTAGGAGEIIRHGIDGYLIPPGHSAAMADHLSGLQRDRQLLLRLGRNALAASRQHPTWDETGGVIRRFLLELVETSRVAG